MAVTFRSLGLVNTRIMFQIAMGYRFAIPAYNFNNMEQLQAVLTGCAQSNSPVILQVSSGARKYANQTLLQFMAQGGVAMVREMGSDIPIALHLDHGDTFELCRSCVETGFSSVMIDGSGKPYEDNVALTKQVVEFAHQFDVTVEGELGVLAGIEDEVSHNVGHYTRPEEVQDFVSRTGVDSLAISIGTSHGAYKFRPGQPVPPLRFDILEEVERRLPGFPIVLHGASSVIQEYVEMINQYGGEMAGAVGVPEEQLRQAATSAVCKVNIDSDGRLAMTAKAREYFALHPGHFDPRQWLGPGREALMQLVMRKNQEVLGSAGWGSQIAKAILAAEQG